MQAKVDELASFLAGAGADVREAMPALDRTAHLYDYLALLTVTTSLGMSRDEREDATAAMSDHDDPMVRAQGVGMTLDAAGLHSLLGRREAVRAQWRSFFEEWDVLICPTALDAAYPHADGDQSLRTLVIDGVEVPYLHNIIHSHWAIFGGQPATAFPAGCNQAGLPLGLQAIGPYLEDRTTLRLAQLLERFERPPGY
jgi:amidase